MAPFGKLSIDLVLQITDFLPIESGFCPCAYYKTVVLQSSSPKSMEVRCASLPKPLCTIDSEIHTGAGLLCLL